MKHSIRIEGFSYKLRPVVIADAGFIVQVRTGYGERSRYIHAISQDIPSQESWIRTYYGREGDYYFVIENRLTGKSEGLIGIYNLDVKERIVEWGRWIVVPGSLCAIESVYLLYRVIFEILDLRGAYSRTLKENEPVVSFHDSLGALNQGVLVNAFEIDGTKRDAVKHFVDREAWEGRIHEKAERTSQLIFEKMLRKEISKMEFHHIGVATRGVEKEMDYWKILGYSPEGDFFSDKLQGIRGVFIVAKNQPRLELLENLPESRTMESWLKKGIKFYHYAYLVDDIDESIVLYTNRFRGKLISPKKPSVAFGLRNICFIMFANGFVIELIEKN